MNIEQTQYCEQYGAQRMVYDGANKLLYRGYAPRGTHASAAGWEIALFAYNANDDIESIKWATGASLIWDNRATYIYA